MFGQTNTQPKVQKTKWHAQEGSQKTFLASDKVFEVLYAGSRGPGKCLPIGERVPTPEGWRPHGDLKPGDTVFGSDGHPIKVRAVHDKHERDVYLLTCSDGRTIKASDNHNWAFSIDHGAAKTFRIGTTLEIKERVDKGYRVQLPRTPCVQYPHRELPLDPYMLGLWVGDGSTTVRRGRGKQECSVEFGSIDAELVEIAIENDFTIRRQKDGFTWLSGRACFYNALKSFGLFETKSDTKFIPSEIMINDKQTRLSFLQGLADSDGTPCKNGGLRISTVSSRLKDDLVSLVRSLGGKSTVGCYHPKPNARQKLPIFNVQITLDDMPFRLRRKAEKYKTCKRKGYFNPKVVSVAFVGRETVSCISVEAEDQLYVAGSDYLVTKNTDALLMAFAKHVGRGYGQWWRGIIFRKTFPELKDIVAKSKRIYPQIFPGAVYHETEKAWHFPDGEVLFFSHMATEDDYWRYHGHEYPFIGWEELTTWVDDACYRKMISCCRSSAPFADMPRMLRATTNPYGPGHNWVKRRFKIPSMDFKVWIDDTEKDKDTGKPIISKPRLVIHGYLKENKVLLATDPDYINTLKSAARNQNELRAWLYGSWDITAGGMFDDLWRTDVHVIPAFPIPRSWRLDRAMDWGGSKPSAIGWFAESDGTPVTIGNRVYGGVRGDIFLIGEWYVSTGKPNEGLNLTPEMLGLGMKEREEDMEIHGRVKPGPGDHNIFDRSQGAAMNDTFKKHRVGFEMADKGPNSRRQGWQTVRDYLEGSIPKEGQMFREQKGLWVFDNCVKFIELVPGLSRDDRDPDDIDTDTEDHIADMLRYRLKRKKRDLKTGSAH